VQNFPEVNIMKAPLTKCFFSAVVLAVLLVLTFPGTSGGFNSRFVRLSDDPNAPPPEASPGWIQPVLLADVNEPAPESWPRVDGPALLETDPNEPLPECYPYQL
jgi:hypothetical protein